MGLTQNEYISYLLPIINHSFLKTNKAVYHLAFWLLAYVFWIFIFRNGTLVLTHALTIKFCYLIFIAGNYYYNTLFTLPVLLNRKKYVAFGLCFLAGILTGAMTRVPVSLMINKYLFK